jgi:hypothetical protein
MGRKFSKRAARVAKKWDRENAAQMRGADPRYWGRLARKAERDRARLLQKLGGSREAAP